MIPTNEQALRSCLSRYGLEQLTEQFVTKGFLGQRLFDLSGDDLVKLGITDRKKQQLLMLAIQAFKTGDPLPSAPDRHSPDYTPKITEQIQGRCHRLGTTPPQAWVEAVEENWPSPIAHEYHRLRMLLSDGDVISAIFQLKALTLTRNNPPLLTKRDPPGGRKRSAQKITRLDQ